MKEIYWKELNLFKKIIFCLGWTGVLNLLFWIIIWGVRNDEPEGKYKEFFNPNTFKVVYVYGWIAFVVLVIGIISNLF